MAEVVLGLAVSHSPQMSMPGENWAAYAANDQRFPLIFRGKKWDWDELVAHREPEGIADEINLETYQAKAARIDTGVTVLRETLAESAPDVIVIVGDDHHEMFTEHLMPTLTVYWGESVNAIPPPEEKIYETVKPAAWALYGDKPEAYTVDAELGRYLLHAVNAAGFDAAHMDQQAEGQSIGHTFIVARTRLTDVSKPMPPIVPILVNTYFPPNVPTPTRCYDFGKVLKGAIEAYPKDLRIAVIATGGLTHFVVDEQLDRALLDAMMNKDEAAVAALSPDDFVSGTSESLCWLTVAGACLDQSMEIVDYVPAYRSPAGTGCAMGMVRWT